MGLQGTFTSGGRTAGGILSGDTEYYRRRGQQIGRTEPCVAKFVVFNIRHEDFHPPFVCLFFVCNAQATPMDSETEWTGEVQS